MKKGFTLIELLVVVLIIGILAAIALPMYNKAVLRSRFAALMPIVKAMNDSNEAYYLEHGQYAINPQDLPVQGQLEYPDGTELEFGSNIEYAYVLATNPDARNNYIMYQKHSVNYPGEIHCEAVTGDEIAEAICEGFSSGEGIGTTLTEGYTTYVIDGNGAGIPTGAFEQAEDDDDPMSCDKATAMGYTCNVTTNEQGQTIKKICTLIGDKNYCRTRTYNENGDYTSITCIANANNVCTSQWKSTTYDENGNILARRECVVVNSSGNCTTWSWSSSYDYTYDANGNILKSRQCSSNYAIDSTGKCNSYIEGNTYNYTYDENGKLLTKRRCSTTDSSGNCTSYYGTDSYDYTNDENGNRLTQRQCSSVDSSTGKCTYNSTAAYDWTYDANGNKVTQRHCDSVNSSSGACTAYSDAENYTYDANGNTLTARSCSIMNDSGKCTSYNGSGTDFTYDENGNRLSLMQCTRVNTKGVCKKYGTGNTYTYDENGNQLTIRKCSSFNTSGICTAYTASGSYDYTYDANGNMLTQWQCSSVDTSGTCTAYEGKTEYVYDDNGKVVSVPNCNGSNYNTATGECIAYNSANVSNN